MNYMTSFYYYFLYFLFLLFLLENKICDFVTN